MGAYKWQVKNTTTSTDVTSIVLSMSFNNGRQNYLDTYNAGALVLTIKNQANESAGFTFGDAIDLQDPTGTTNQFRFYVVEVSYNDYPGNTGLSTATVTCQDGLGVLGRLQMDAFSISANPTAGQFLTVGLFVPGRRLLDPDMLCAGVGSACSAGVYSGSVLNFVNLLVNTERTLLSIIENKVIFYSRDLIATLPVASASYGRTADASTIAYEGFERINLGLDLMNQVQVQPTGLATQQATNTASVSTYGANGFTVSTVDANVTQALGLANWLANTLSDTTKQRFVIQFTDVAQPAGAPSFFDVVNSLAAKDLTSLTFRVPGAATDTTVQVICEGFNVSATPSQSTVTAYLTPLTYYQFFTLDSATLGILGGTGIIYNTPMDYNEAGYTYNDNTADNGSRLGF